MTAREIEKLLKEKHSEDVFVPQCKTGPSVTGVQIFDGWALKPSWSHQMSIGYEIKVSRGDYMRDQKWRGYLPYCNEFYFVTPSGLIDKSEIPEGVGLMVTSGRRLLIKKKAEYHEATMLEPLYKYILMYHSGLIRRGYSNLTREERIEEWRKRIEEKDRIDQLGWNTSRALKKRIDDEIVIVQRENDRLKKQNEELLAVKEALRDLGFNLNNIPRWDPKGRISKRLEEIETGFPENAVRIIGEAKIAIERVQQLIAGDAK